MSILENSNADAMVVRSYLKRLLDAGINVPTEVMAAAERILQAASREPGAPT